jgi:hypothetical protein
MGNLINRVLGEMSDQPADQTISYAMMASAAAAAQGYLAATLLATTPELRAILSSFVSQKVMEHETLTGFVMNRNWMNPYDDAHRQLEASYIQSQSIVSRQILFQHRRPLNGETPIGILTAERSAVNYWLGAFYLAPSY